jgi:L-lactate dehydrogenase complex protein LldG
MEVRSMWDEFAERVFGSGCEVIRRESLALVAPEACDFLEGLAIAATPSGMAAFAAALPSDEVSVAPPLHWYGLTAAGIVCADLLVAETGSVVLVDDSLENRIVSMLSNKLVVISTIDRLVPTMREAGHWLDSLPGMPPYVVFMTGPSRTADIERSLTIGVQGPSQVLIVVTDGEPG